MVLRGRAGITVSAMSSVSADTPSPLLLVCIHHASPVSAAIIGNGCFCVNLLRDDQSYISDVFAGRFKTPDGDKFTATDWIVSQTGSPRVRDSLVSFDCQLDQHMQVGTHHVFFGAVVETHVARAGLALIYANRAYGSPSRLLAARTGGQSGAGSRRLRLGCFPTFGPYLVPEMLARLQDRVGAIDLHLVEGDQRRLIEGLRTGEIELAMLYDFDLDDAITREPVQELHVHALLSEQDPLSAKRELTLADLAPRPLILLDVPPSCDYFLSLFRDRGLNPEVAYRSASLEMVRGLVGNGLGYSLLATKPFSDMTYDGRVLVAREIADKTRPSRLVLAQDGKRELGSTAGAFREICREQLVSR